jgi:hypothetical protein
MRGQRPSILHLLVAQQANRTDDDVFKVLDDASRKQKETDTSSGNEINSANSEDKIESLAKTIANQSFDQSFTQVEDLKDARKKTAQKMTAAISKALKKHKGSIAVDDIEGRTQDCANQVAWRLRHGSKKNWFFYTGPLKEQGWYKVSSIAYGVVCFWDKTRYVKPTPLTASEYLKAEALTDEALEQALKPIKPPGTSGLV